MSVEIYKTVSGKEQRLHVGQIGPKFQAALGTTAFNMATATRQQFAFKNPAGTITRKDASEVNAPAGTSRTFTDEFGVETALLVQLEYTIAAASELATAGTWTVWVEVESPTYEHYGVATEFEVFAVGGV